MKNLTYFTVAAFLLFSVPSISQSQPSSDNYFYVVIGAFANPRNANEFTESAKKKHLDARSTFVASRKLNYVYILEVPEKDKAISMAMKLQSESKYSDTWVYAGLLTDHPVAVKFEKKEIVETPKVNEDSVKQEPKETITEPIKPLDGSKPFVFKIHSIDNGKEVLGDIDVYDADIIKGRKVVSYRGNDVVNVKPVNKSGNMLVVCDLFGYRKVQLPVNFNNPKIEDAISLDGGNIAVNIELVRLKKGEKVTMYNVYFFNHAAIMRPESRYEVNELLDMLKEKPTSKIRIHGHSNGNASGKLITLGNSKDFFSLSKDNNEDNGSALKLSEERARIIQSYLVSQGIDVNRMDLKAWGGKKPIYDEDHSLAQANVRVEIEILED